MVSSWMTGPRGVIDSPRNNLSAVTLGDYSGSFGECTGRYQINYVRGNIYCVGKYEVWGRKSDTHTRHLNHFSAPSSALLYTANFSFSTARHSFIPAAR